MRSRSAFYMKSGCSWRVKSVENSITKALNYVLSAVVSHIVCSLVSCTKQISWLSSTRKTEKDLFSLVGTVKHSIRQFWKLHLEFSFSLPESPKPVVYTHLPLAQSCIRSYGLGLPGSLVCRADAIVILQGDIPHDRCVLFYYSYVGTVEQLDLRRLWEIDRWSEDDPQDTFGSIRVRIYVPAEVQKRFHHNTKMPRPSSLVCVQPGVPAIERYIKTFSYIKGYAIVSTPWFRKDY